MNKQKPKNNGKLFVLLTITVIIIIGLFTFFIYVFTQYDKTEFEVAEGSVIYNSEREYIKTSGSAYITQKFDRNYYLYEEKDGEKIRYKLGKNAVVYKEGDMYVYIYGTAYQILTSGDVDTLSGETKVVKASPTKFFKLDDREYLIVDSEIRSSENDVLNTKDYLLVSIDKQGNPSFSNHLVDFKTISKTIISTSLFYFDIANEKLTYEKQEIDLKNVIGSSNEYEPPKEEKIDYTDEKIEALQNNINDSSNAIVGYYDQYFKDVVSSVNNLTTSVIGVNNNTIASLSKGETYYNFEYWLALKSVKSNVSSIDVAYTIFDPTNEFQEVHLIVDGPIESTDGSFDDPDESVHSLSKTDSNYTIRDLKPNTPYQITLAYTKPGDPEATLEDTIVTTTKKDKYEIKISKISFKEEYTPEGINNYIELNYELIIDPEYKFTYATVNFEMFDMSGDSKGKIPPFQVEGKNIDSTGIHKGVIKLPTDQVLNYKNMIWVDNLKFCTGVYPNELCTLSDITFEYKFYNDVEAHVNAAPEAEILE